MKKQVAAKPVELSLPTEPNVPRELLGDYSMLLYGDEKVGKTTLAAQFPEALVLLFEPGGKALPIYSRAVNSWTEALGYFKLLRESRRFKTVVLDIVDVAYELCLDHVCKRMGIGHPTDEGYGKGWSAVRKEFGKAMMALVGGTRGVIFVSHAKDKTLKRRSGEETSRLVPTMANQAREVLEPIVDIWAYYTYTSDGGRVLRIAGDDFVAAGHRVERHFVGIREIAMGRNAREGFANYVKAFNTTAPAAEKGGTPKAATAGGRKVVRRVSR